MTFHPENPSMKNKVCKTPSGDSKDQQHKTLHCFSSFSGKLSPLKARLKLLLLKLYLRGR